jgi:hypothetical protein
MTRPCRHPGRLRRAARVLPAFLLAGSLLAACSSARVIQGTTDETCYLALPTAEDAVGTQAHAHLEGVRKFTVSSLQGPAPRLYDRLKDEVPLKDAVCLVAYTGHFTSSDVSKGFGRASGSLAVVAVKTPGNRLLGTLVLAHLPVSFDHTHPF